MRHTIINREFRDFTAESAYPFQDTAPMENDYDIKIVPEVFLDALIYSVENRSLPFYLAELLGSQGTDEQMGVVVKDNTNREVCTGLIDTGTPSSPQDTCYLYNNADDVAGTLVFSPEHMRQLVRHIGIEDVSFTKTQTPFMAERCFVTRSGGLSVVTAANNSFPYELRIVGANGVHFTEDSGEVYFHLLGEEKTGGASPVKTINSKSFKHMWLAAHPESAVKVVTKGNEIKIRKISDAE